MTNHLRYLIISLLGLFFFTSQSLWAQNIMSIESPIGLQEGVGWRYYEPYVLGTDIYMRYGDDIGNYRLVIYDGNNLIAVESPVGYAADRKGYTGKIIQFNSDIYVLYYSDANVYKWFKYNGNTLSEISLPTAVSPKNYDPIIFNDALYLMCVDDNSNLDLLCKYNGDIVTKTAFPSGYQYFGSPLVYNGHLTMALREISSNDYIMFKYDGSDFTKVPAPRSGFNSGLNVGYRGYPIVFDGNLYMCYLYAAVGNETSWILMKYDGSTMTEISSPSGFRAYRSGYDEVDPLIVGNHLYLIYNGDDGKSDLVKYDGNSLEVISKPVDIDFVYPTLIEYNSKVYFRGKKTDGAYILGEYDGNSIKEIPTPANFGNYNNSPVVVGSNLYLSYYNDAGKTQLVKYDGFDLTGIQAGADLANGNYYGSSVAIGSTLYGKYKKEDGKYVLATYNTCGAEGVTCSGTFIAICDGGGYLSPAGNLYTESGSYTDILVGANGQDSLVFINLTINSTTLVQDSLVSNSVCEGTTKNYNAYTDYLSYAQFNSSEKRYIEMDTVANAIAGTSRSIFMWINTPNVSSESRVLFAVNSSSGGNISNLQISTDEKIGIYDGSNSRWASGNVTNNVSHYVGYTYDASTYETKIYVDGLLVKTFTNNQTISANSRISLGQEWDSNTPSNFYYGKMTEVSIWDEVLDSTDIALIKDATILSSHPKYANLKAYYPMNLSCGADLSEVRDFSGNEYHGVASNNSIQSTTDFIQFEDFNATAHYNITWKKNGNTVATTSSLNIGANASDDGAYQLRMSRDFVSITDDFNFSVNAVIITKQPKDIAAPLGSDVTFKVETSGGPYNYQWIQNIESIVNKTTADGLGSTSSNGVYESNGTIYLATDGGLSISSDGGNSFVTKTTADGLGSNICKGVYESNRTIYVATNGGLSISTNDGDSFTNKTTIDGLLSDKCNGVYESNGTIYVATSVGLSISSDGGNSFVTKTTADGLRHNVCQGVYESNGTLYVATWGGLSISTDGGNSFVTKTTADGLGNDYCMGVYEANGTIYVATLVTLSISNDSGNSFVNRTKEDGLANSQCFGVYVSDGTVYIATKLGISILSEFKELNGETAATLTLADITNDMDSPSYSVQITHQSSGCSSISNTATLTIGVANVLAIELTVDSTVNCFGSTNGGITVEANGGTAPYTYGWSNSDTTASITGLGAATYRVLVTDANNDTISEAVEITQPELITSIATLYSTDSIVWIDGITYKINNDTATFTLESSGGCDSIVTLNFTKIDGLITSHTALTVDESENSKTFTVKLGSQPLSDVVFNISSDALDEAIVSPSEITFTKDSWNSAQTITITGVNDSIVDGTQIVIISLIVDASKSEDRFDELNSTIVTVSVEDNDTPGYTVSDTTLTVNESGNSKTYTVVLNSKPSSDVVFNLSSNDSNEASVSPSVLTFTIDNWNSAQTITVTGVNDSLVDAVQTALVTLSVDPDLSDDNFDELENETLTVKVEDDDTPGFSVSDSTLTVNENGIAKTFTVKLLAQPATDVLFNVSNNAADKASVSPSELTFTKNNWNSTQTITVTGVNDSLVDGTQIAILTLSIDENASDDNFDNLDNETITVSIEDDDTPGFSVSDSTLTVSENANSKIFTVKLEAKPSTDVVFNLNSNATDEAVVSPAVLTFTKDNWNSSQSVTIIGVNDSLIDGMQVAEITLSIDASLSDDAFDNIKNKFVFVNVEDNDSPGFIISDSLLIVNETKSSKTFTVKLEAKPSSNVVFDLLSNAIDEVSVSPSILTFTSDNWNSEQTVTITGVNDSILDGTQTAFIKLTVNADASDNSFDNLSEQKLIVEIQDDDSPGFLVSDTLLVVNENESSKSFSTKLSAQPLNDVVFNLEESNDEFVVSPSSLKFTKDNWNVFQSATVSGVNDSLVDGTQMARLKVSVDQDASDDQFDILSFKSIDIYIEDNDTPGASLSDSTLTINESGSSKEFTIVLEAKPISDVVFDLTSYNVEEVEVSPSSFIFTTNNWNSPQALTVTGVDDSIVDGSQNTLIVFEINKAITDDSFDDLSSLTIAINNEDNDSPGFALSDTLLIVNENESVKTFTTVLKSEPLSDVVFDIESSSIDEATVLPSTLTFTKDNWSSKQTVIVTGVNDSLVDGTQNSFIKLSINTLESDDAFDGLSEQFVNVKTEDNNSPNFVVSESLLIVDENGSLESFNVVLNSKPQLEVIFNLLSNDEEEVSVSPSKLTFTKDNWNSKQVVTVTGMDDVLIDGMQTTRVEISIDTLLSDNQFDNLSSKSVEINNEDNDTPGFTVSDSLLVVDEKGLTKSFEIVLNARPINEVIIDLSSDRVEEVTVSPSSVTFKATDWDIPQIASINGVNDSLIDGLQSAKIKLEVNSSLSDDEFGNLSFQNLIVNNEDDDTPGFSILNSEFAVSENENEETFNVILDAKPNSDVVLQITSSAIDEATVLPSTLTFTTDNWNAKQLVTVKGVDDELVDGLQLTRVRLSIDTSLSDKNFVLLGYKNLEVNVEDNDTPDFIISDSSITVNEGGSTGFFEIVLAAQPNSDVVLENLSKDEDEATVAPSQLTFTFDNWNIPQKVTVTGVDDILVDGVQNVGIEVAVNPTLSDDSFDNVLKKQKQVNVQDNDTPVNIEITSIVHPTCNGSSNGILIATVSLGTANYTYEWSNGETTSNSPLTTNSIIGIEAGTYTVIVTDMVGSKDTATAIVEDPELLSLNITEYLEEDVSNGFTTFCNGGSDGGMQAIVSGGTQPYNYEWSTGFNEQILTHVAAATYSVVVTDANGCNITQSHDILEPQLIIGQGKLTL